MRQLNFNNIDQRLKDELSATLAIIPELESFLFKIFFINQVYQDIFSKEIYFVFNVNEDYILLIHQKKINELLKDLSVEDIKNLQPSRVESFYSVYLGIYLKNKDRISDITNDLKIKNYIVDLNVDLGPSLQDALRRIFVNKYEFSKKESSSFFLPKFNIFMNGHGSKEDIFVGITDQYFEKILVDFNNRVWVKNLLVSSCYPGGKRFLKEEKALRKLNYPVIFEGSLATFVYFTGFDVNWLEFFKNFDRNFFTNIFKVLSDVSVDYQRLFKELETTVKSVSDITNYISIKFPNTEWITASDYSKEVLNLTNTKMFVLGDKTVHIPREKNIILLNTDVILGTLFFDFPINLNDESINPRAYSFDQSADNSTDKKVNFKILPIYYKNNNYFISKMKFKIVESLDSFYSSPEANSFESTSSVSTDLDKKDLLDQYFTSLLKKIFYFSDSSLDISMESPIFIRQPGIPHGF
jgi:hypothetical protein